MSPSESLLCDIFAVLSETLYILGADACWKVELFNGGKLEGDVSDVSCSNTEYTSNGIYSLFNLTNGSNNTAIFVDGPKAFSGTFQFIESLDVIKPLMRVLSWNNEVKEYKLEITLPSCSALSVTPTVTPSTSLSSTPSSSVCPIEATINRTYYLKAAGLCWQVQLFSGGTLEASSNNFILTR